MSARERRHDAAGRGPSPAPRPWARLLRRGAVLAGLWVVLAEGELSGLPVALGAILLATWASERLSVPPQAGAMRLRLRALPAFAAYFVRRSLAGGVDVARRAFSPRLPLAPGFVEHTLTAPPGPARLLLAHVVSLVPGTLACELRGDTLLVHVLDRHAPVARELQELERAVLRLFEPPPGRTGAPADAAPH